VTLVPIYVYRCPACGREAEELRRVSECGEAGPTCKGGAINDEASHAPVAMPRAPTTASFGFKTKGGNFASFSPSHGPVTRGNRRPKTVSRGAGLGGRRPPPSPKNDPEFRAQLAEFSKGKKP
jgi:hypothetical protein